MKKIVGLSDLDDFVKSDFLPFLKEYKIFLFLGNLGAGKTTFIKKVLEISGVLGIITSPTFNYVNSYKNKKGIVFNHFDLYRIDSLDSFLNMGLEEFFQSDSFNFIEWPEIIFDYLKQSEFEQKTCVVSLNYCLENFSVRIFCIQPLKSFKRFD